jgi:hypothetical protein
MRFRRDAGFMVLVGVSLLLGVVCPLSASAQQSSSTHYEVNDVFFGSGGALNDCSTTYCAKEALGETGVGNTKSTNYQAQAGFNTNRNPYIAFTVTGGSTNLGTLSTAATATTTATFSVKAYNSSGYIVQLASPGPTDTLPSHHVLTSPSTPTASAVGTEQFGINLVNNTTGCGAPTNFGANPIQVPAGYGYGAAASGYNTCGLFKYVNGDTIAASTSSSGTTNYTISYIYNISNVTQDGEYAYNGVLVATATY